MKLIQSQYLWYNKYVLKENKPFILLVFLGRGKKYLCNLIGPDGYFKNWEVIQLEFDMEENNLLDWYGIVQSIPNAWKNRIKSMQAVHLQDIPSYYNCLLVGQKYIKPSSLSSSMIYEACISKVFKPPTSRRYFERILGVIEEEEWRNIYTLKAKVTVCTSLRIFQYKILNNILYLNARLFKMHMVDSGLCSLCNSAEESVLHLFLECRISSALWLQVQSWCTGVITLPDLSPKIIYFGINSGTFENLALNNHIVLLYKKFLYDYRNNACGISLRSFQHYLFWIQEIERKIEARKNKLTCHHKKWIIFWRSYQFINKLTTAKAQFKITIHIQYCSPTLSGGWRGLRGRGVGTVLLLFVTSQMYCCAVQ